MVAHAIVTLVVGLVGLVNGFVGLVLVAAVGYVVAPAVRVVSHVVTVVAVRCPAGVLVSVEGYAWLDVAFHADVAIVDRVELFCGWFW